MNKAIYYIDQSSTERSSTVPEQVVNIPIGDVFEKSTFLPALAEVCNFPSYFGHNWDAVWDCLTDSEVTHLKLNLTDVKKVNHDDLNSFKSVIEDAYNDFGKPQLWIIMAPVDCD